MSIVPRGVKNVLRNPFRLILVVLLLGVSLMFVATMVSLNQNAQSELDAVHKQVGTQITINYATNKAGGISQGSNVAGSTGSSTGNSNNSQGSANPAAGGNPGQGIGGSRNGQGGGFQQPKTTPLPQSAIDTVSKTSGIASVETSLQETDTDNILKTSTFQSPNGQSITVPARVTGFSKGATHFTLSGSTPTITSGRMLQNSDDNKNVAVISQTLATNNSLKVGSTFTLKGTTMTVVGIYKATASQFSDTTIVVPMATVQRIYAVNGVDSITAYAASYDQVSAAASKLRTTLGSKYDITTSDDLYASTFSAINVAKNSIQLALIVSVMTAAVVIVFAVIILVRERTLEIGTLKAIGASHWQVVRQFWSEVFTLSLLSSLLAVVLLATLGPTISAKFDITTPTSQFGGNGTGVIATGNGFAGRSGSGGGFGGGFGGFLRNAQSQLTNVHIASATLDLQTLLMILGLGIALAIVTSIIPALYVARIKPAIVLRKGN